MIPQEIILKKSQIMESFRDLPEDVTADDLIERILFVKLIQERLLASQYSPGIPHEQFMQEFKAFRAEKHAQKLS